MNPEKVQIGRLRIKEPILDANGDLKFTTSNKALKRLFSLGPSRAPRRQDKLAALTRSIRLGYRLLVYFATIERDSWSFRIRI